VQAHARQPSVEQEAVHRRSKLTDKQVATVAQPCMSPRHKPTLEVEMILIIDFASPKLGPRKWLSPSVVTGARLRPPRPSL
jgi:hypothetical protein